MAPKNMKNENSQAPAPSPLWYYAGGALSLIVGAASITAPYLASELLVQLTGVFCVASGVILLISALFGKNKKHWLYGLFSALLRGVVGVLLLANVIAGLYALTVTLAALFVVEGLFEMIFAVSLFRKTNKAWPWVALNAIAAFALGGILFSDLPGDSTWSIGLLFGINSLFLGVSLIMVAAHRPQSV